MIKYAFSIVGLWAIADSALAHNLPALPAGAMHELLHSLPFFLAIALCVLIAKKLMSRKK